MTKKFFKIRIYFILLSIFNISFTYSEEVQYKNNVIKEISTIEEIQNIFFEQDTRDINVKNDNINSEIQPNNNNEIIDNETNNDKEKNIKIIKSENIEIRAKEDRFEEVRDRSNRVTALGSAMGAIDLGSTPTKKIRIGAGVGNSSSSQAVAVGVGYAPTDRFKINTKVSSSTDSKNNHGISVGASYDLDI